MAHLGITLYTPATHPALAAISAGKYPGLTNHVWCTEDAIRDTEVGAAVQNILRQLEHAEPFTCRLYLRVRSPEILAELVRHDLSRVHGFILPKVHDGNLRAYMDVLPSTHAAQLTLETREALSEHRMMVLRDLIFQEAWQGQVEGLRIGGNDLMNVLGVRRTPGRTLYEGPLERSVSMLLGIFRPYGFQLSSPVYEVFSDLATLAREVRQDLEYGLSGKTIIHPVQLPTVLGGYRVPAQELEEAQAILAPDAPAVFQMNGRMCEPATHRRWAQDITERAALYGLLPPTPGDALHYLPSLGAV
ncbi:hypothetical protein GO986_12440 [Deinococcus sp. HMF7620]|uniref:Citrate lyase beta subunit n=1 Tax=Deinococcus arboris TaxID=2682977 RepID=A0A7C9I010_9DEIO|nr:MULTISPECIES: HpcH/HpaI aldolase/citrate lyase family protein [Deinococcus]MBZ9749768.1 HpcH/HpaI aldolase/citrate lyase family protein [Deinococcus betulae]MVN87575.1 hypothetical protein [Deinococcus arboris]